jgi:hypothetical protein
MLEDDKVQLVPFLVQGKLRKSEYMVDEPTYRDIQNLVMASSEEEAEDKFIKHYESKSSSYEVDYSVVNVVVNKTLI